MTSHNEPAPAEKSFVASKLPWDAAAAVMVVYFVTLNRWVAVKNVSDVALASGWDLSPELLSPVFNPVWYVVTLPFHWLPATWVPMAYNFLALVCGGLTLALLARSV